MPRGPAEGTDEHVAAMLCEHSTSRVLVLGIQESPAVFDVHGLPWLQNPATHGQMSMYFIVSASKETGDLGRAWYYHESF